MKNYVLAGLERRLGNYTIALTCYNWVVDNLDLKHANIGLPASYPEFFAPNGQFDSAQCYYNLIDSLKLDSHDRR